MRLVVALFTLTVALSLGACKDASPSLVQGNGVTTLLSKKDVSLIGERLFRETGFSRNGIACATCHSPDTYFQDGFERAVNNGKFLRRNTPTLLNINRYTKFFWDGRAENLHDQMDGPLFSLAEMNSTEESIQSYVNEDPMLSRSFKSMRGSGLVQNEVDFVKRSLLAYMHRHATRLTVYEMSLQGGETLSRQAIRGKNLFYGKANCSSCHSGSNFTDNKFYDIGLYRRNIIPETIIENDEEIFSMGSDRGLGDIQPGMENLYKFRTPSLINVALTAPYMHDGSLPTLESVIDFFARGGDIPKLQAVDLTVQEKRDLVAFLKTLTDVRYAVNERE